MGKKQKTPPAERTFYVKLKVTDGDLSPNKVDIATVIADLLRDSNRADSESYVFDEDPIVYESFGDLTTDECGSPEERTEVDFDELAEFAKSLGLDEQDFDGQVHDAKGDEAADLNNQGMASQLEFLYGGMPLAMIKAEIQQLADNEPDEEDDLVDSDEND